MVYGTSTFTKSIFVHHEYTNLLFSILQYNLYAHESKVMPQYDNGSRGSEVEDVGIGAIM